ncbi:MAG: GNAT family N-acetyltransferase [Acidimicrobiales bacterium]
MDGPVVSLVPWGEGDLALLERLLGDPSMMGHLGGPESAQQIAARHARYVSDPARLFKIALETEGVGWVGYWERIWRDEQVYEIGWAVVPERQGRGIAARATAEAVGRARAEGGPTSLHAFPAVDNRPSNAICARTGFTLIAQCRLEYPPGHSMTCNDWRYDLAGPRTGAAAP